MNGPRPERIARDLEALATRTEPDRPWTRQAFTPLFLEGRAYLTQAMAEAGLTTRIDAGGNLIGRRAGAAEIGAILVGSHSDTVPAGGRFDGVAGVVAGIEIARVLRDEGADLRHHLEVVDCLAEEVSLFGVSCVGSRAMTGALPPEWLEREHRGRTLAQALTEVGGDPARLAEARRTDIRAFLEAHIEQGPVLESGALDIGLVTAIVGITRVAIAVEGRADHAGTTPMNARADALVAGADLTLEIKRWADARARASAGHFAATVGEFTIRPNAANVVPAGAKLLVDARAEFPGDMADFLVALQDICRVVAERRGVAIPEPIVVSDNVATPCDPGLLDRMEAAAADLGLRYRRMASGAGHDAAWFARVAPSAMVFTPCRGGRSHTPEEWADADAIARAAAVLLETIRRLDGRPARSE